MEESQTYPNINAFHDSMKRSGTRHATGWHIKSNSSTTLTVIWSNDPPPPPTVEEIKIKDLKIKLKDDTMTFKELLELLRLTGIV